MNSGSWLDIIDLVSAQEPEAATSASWERKERSLLFLIYNYTQNAEYMEPDGDSSHRFDVALVPTSATSQRKKRKKR